MIVNNKNNEFLELLQTSKKGKLKIYIGSAAGVGKTYKMLQEAHELREKGVDVVVGFVETHSRVETTKLVKGLEVIPRLKYDYSGIKIEEMDLDAILARRPEVVIVDELAHTNLPVCRNEKRYQDVIELMLAGINVICAFNVQHLESLNDIILAVTETKVNETIPDSFVKEADQVVNIDISESDLIERLRSGKIYPIDKIDQALENFFTFDNISRLRELALREVAERVESYKEKTVAGQDGLEASCESIERVMVCFFPSQVSQKYLLRRASRIAGKLSTDWHMVYVETEADQPEKIDSQVQRMLYSDMQFAAELGGSFVHIKGEDRVKEWIKFGESERIKHIVIANKDENIIDLVMGRSHINSLLKSKQFDLHIINMAQENEK